MSAAHCIIGWLSVIAGIAVCKTVCLVSDVKRHRYTTLRDEVGRD